MIKYISLKNINMEGFVGCLPEERINKNKIKVDVKLEVNMDNMFGEENDDIDNTVDYREIVNVLKKTLNERHFAVIENLAEHMGRNLLESFSQVEKAEVVLTKPEALAGGIIPEVVSVNTRY